MWETGVEPSVGKNLLNLSVENVKEKKLLKEKLKKSLKIA